MKNVLTLIALFLLGMFFLQCENVTNKQKLQDAEARAQAAQARLDSIKNAEKMAIVDKAKAEQDIKDGKMPSVSIKEVGKVNPVDEGQMNPSFRDFRRDLMSAVGRKDVSHIMGILSDEIKYSFDETDGKEGFKKAWGLDVNSTESELWQELNKILSLGGTFENRSQSVFTAPYVFTSFSQGYDPAEYAVVTGQGVRMREKPSRSSRNMATLSYDVVRLLPDSNPRRERIGKERHYWRKVQTENGTVGYVYGKYVHSPTDYRASFEKDGKDWKMFMFVKGEEKDAVESATDSL